MKKGKTASSSRAERSTHSGDGFAPIIEDIIAKKTGRRCAVRTVRVCGTCANRIRLKGEAQLSMLDAPVWYGITLIRNGFGYMWEDLSVTMVGGRKWSETPYRY